MRGGAAKGLTHRIDSNRENRIMGGEVTYYPFWLGGVGRCLTATVEDQVNVCLDKARTVLEDVGSSMGGCAIVTSSIR